MLEKLFNAHLGPMRDDIREIKDGGKIAYQRADDAHRRIDRYENRFFGWLAGISLGGGAIGAWLAKSFPAIFN